jgi:hypothetical protein
VYRRLAITAALAALLGASGCTASGSSSSSAKFTGTKGDVAKVVSDLSQAGRRKQADRICTQILARTFVQQLSQAGTSCAQEMKKAIDDADDFDLTVRSVTVTGSRASAVVRRGKDGPTATFRFVRDGNAWKATSFGG